MPTVIKNVDIHYAFIGKLFKYLFINQIKSLRVFIVIIMSLLGCDTLEK